MLDALPAKGNNVVPVDLICSLSLKSVMFLYCFKLNSREGCITNQLDFIGTSKTASLIFPFDIDAGFLGN